MKALSIITLIFFCVLSVLIYITKNYQYKKYLIDKKSEEIKVYKVNLNLADQRELENLPEIGPKLAKLITEDRKTNGRFSSISDLMRVKGIGKKKFVRIEKYLTLDV